MHAEHVRLYQNSFICMYLLSAEINKLPGLNAFKIFPTSYQIKNIQVTVYLLRLTWK